MKLSVKASVAAVLLSTFSCAYASQTFSLEKSEEFFELSKGYNISVKDIHADSEVHDFNTRAVKVDNDSNVPFYRYLLEIEKDGEEWSKQIIVFSGVDNVIGLDALLFGQFLNTTDLDHLDEKHAYDFYRNLHDILSQEYKVFKGEYEKSLSGYLDYMAINADFEGYIKRTGAASDKINAALQAVEMPEPPSPEQLISRFIKAVNDKDEAWLLAQQLPDSSERGSGIYTRGLDVLYRYFDALGNPAEFDVVRQEESPSYIKTPHTYIIVELLNHTEQGKKIEMEFTFVDTFGGRYVGEYDITGVHFQ
ncbi:hypothetical protein [Oceanimonas baumannii]|uniref:hypothetical protein n=1 Tax=Oceanimonas baumannii TaxID=129578 RepID=UPI003A95D122